MHFDIRQEFRVGGIGWLNPPTLFQLAGQIINALIKLIADIHNITIPIAISPPQLFLKCPVATLRLLDRLSP